MTYKIIVMSLLLPGSFQTVFAMQQAQQPTRLRASQSYVVGAQHGTVPHASQYNMQPHAAAYQGLVQQVREKDAMINTLVRNQNQQNQELNQIMSDLNELLTRQAVAIGELKAELNIIKKQVAAMEEKK